MRLAAAACLLLLAPARAVVDYTATGAALEIPPTYTSSGGELAVSLSMAAFLYTAPSGSSWYTRGFNGAFPGPLLRIRAGDTVRLTLTNELGAETVDMSGMEYHNQIRQANTTNVHTHGLHVSSAAPSDDVFIELAPGESYEYVYSLPSFHMGGTHWYHPHHHGSTALQAGGGACGMIIVEDADDEVPPELASLIEVPLVLTHVDSNAVAALETESNGALHVVSGAAVNVVLANGQLQPVISLVAGTWTRLRMVFASINARLALRVPEQCELRLIAKDGGYLHTAPRTLTDSVQMYPGARADVLVRCAAGGPYALTSSDARRRRRLEYFDEDEQAEEVEAPDEEEDVWQPSGEGDCSTHAQCGAGAHCADRVCTRLARRQLQGGKGGGGGGGNEVLAVTIATFSVSGSDPASTTEFPTFAVHRPCYLADLTGSGASVTATAAITLGPAPDINGAVFESHDTHLLELAPASVHEWTLQGVNAHPFHLHINPYQITAITTSSEYFQVRLCAHRLRLRGLIWARRVFAAALSPAAACALRGKLPAHAVTALAFQRPAPWPRLTRLPRLPSRARAASVSPSSRDVQTRRRWATGTTRS
jgi:FtsP/CotA-like multicopper oxidase with cupredoxin domain